MAPTSRKQSFKATPKEEECGTRIDLFEVGLKIFTMQNK
jgi:hypothetical protein